MQNVDITFLHTDDVHIETFSRLIDKQSLSIISRHVVHSELLKEAIDNGLTNGLESSIKSLCLGYGQNSALVVCTCSTLGSIAEQVILDNGQQVVRIDRAMADLAVLSANKILVLAALESTLKPTSSLMNSSQQKRQTQNEIEYCVVDNSWQYFLKGEQHAYFKSIADIIDQKQGDYDCIVLAQASMAGAIDLVLQNRALILSSPEIGIEAVVKKLVKQAV